MSTTLAITLISSSLVIGFCVGWLVGEQSGVERGRDTQWMADFFGRIEREKARRDKRGRFKSNANKTN